MLNLFISRTKIIIYRNHSVIRWQMFFQTLWLANNRKLIHLASTLMINHATEKQSSHRNMAIIGVRCTKRSAVVKDDRVWRQTDQMRNCFSKFQEKQGRLKRTKHMSLILLLPPGIKRTTFPWITVDNTTSGHQHVEPSVWTPSCAMQPLGGASWLPFHP